MTTFLLPTDPVVSIDGYLAHGVGGSGVRRAHELLGEATYFRCCEPGEARADEDRMDLREGLPEGSSEQDIYVRLEVTAPPELTAKRNKFGLQQGLRLLPGGEMAYQLRRDFIQNSNDSYRWSNPALPPTDRGPMLGTDFSFDGLPNERTRAGTEAIQHDGRHTLGCRVNSRCNSRGSCADDHEVDEV